MNGLGEHVPHVKPWLAELDAKEPDAAHGDEVDDQRWATDQVGGGTMDDDDVDDGGASCSAPAARQDDRRSRRTAESGARWGGDGAMHAVPPLPPWGARLSLLSLLPPTPALAAALLGKLAGAMDARLEGKHALACSRGDARSRVAARSDWCCCSRCNQLRMGEWRVRPTPAATLSEALEGADTELRGRRAGGEESELKEGEEEEEEEEWEERGESGTAGAAAAGAEPHPADAGGTRSTASSGSMA